MSNLGRTNSGKPAHNMSGLMWQARREARRTSFKIKSPWQSLFGPKRANTMSAVEEGRDRDMGPVRQTQTAPHAQTPTSAADEERGVHNGNENGNENFESQADTLTSPTANGTTGKEKKGTFRERWFAKLGGNTKSGKPAPSIAQQLKSVLFENWVNLLLVAVPAGIATSAAGVNGSIVFAVNFIAIIPLAGLLSFATEELADRLGETLSGLINATFGNAVELIVAIIALAKGEVEVVQTSLIGSILSNLLLVLGMCFFFGGWRRQVQHFNKTVAQTSASMLALAVASNIVPTVFSNYVKSQNGTDATDTRNIAAISRGTSVILLVVYGAYLFFQLSTHREVFNEPSEKSERKPRKHHRKHHEKHGAPKDITTGLAAATATGAGLSEMKQKDGEHVASSSGVHRRVNESRDSEKTSSDGHSVNTDGHAEGNEEVEHEAKLTPLVSVIVLLISTVLIAFCAEFMVSGISDITASGAISVEFVGLILLPIVGNAAEHVTAVTVAIKDKMDLAIGVAVGSSMQVSLFLIPFLVIIGWIMGNEDMTLAFDTFQIAVIFVSVLLVNYLIGDGESHWLEGFLLMCLYLIIATCSWYYPASANVVG